MKTGCVAFLPERRYRWSMSVLLLLAWATAASAAIVDVEVVSDRKGLLPLYRAGSAGRGDTYRAYVEAEKGELYGIRIRNNTGRRIGVVVAVDGRNIVSGEKSTLRKTERMYILGPYESADYDGWRTARDTVNRFYFTDPGDSYAGAFGDHSAMGVVAVAVYREKDPPPLPRFSQREREPMGQEDGGGAREPGPMGAEESARGNLPRRKAGMSRAPGSGTRNIPPRSASGSPRSAGWPSAISSNTSGGTRSAGRGSSTAGLPGTGSGTTPATGSPRIRPAGARERPSRWGAAGKRGGVTSSSPAGRPAVPPVPSRPACCRESGLAGGIGLPGSI